MLQNIFEVGKEVSGKSMIGYARYLEKLRTMLENHRSVAITGVRRVGKTSLAKEVLREIQKKDDHSIAIMIDLGRYNSFESFLMALYRNLKREISRHEDLRNNEDIQYTEGNLDTESPEDIFYREDLSYLFKLMNDLGFHSLLMLDEFDVAMELFPSTAEFEFIRDLSSNKETDVMLVLVSRRHLYMIERKNLNNSTLDGCVTTMVIGGFNSDDISTFYDTLQTGYGIEVAAQGRERIHYYAGRSPYIYSMFGHTMVEKCSQKAPISVEEIYQENEIDIQNHYKAIFSLMLDDNYNIPGGRAEKNSIEKLVSVIVGPIIGLTREDIQYLKDMNYISENGDAYYSLSSYFTDYLKTQELNVDSWNLLITTEKKLKLMVRRQTQRRLNSLYITYDEWSDLISAVGENAALPVYDGFLDNVLNEYHKSADLLDVISLAITVKIIHWGWEDVYSSFFGTDSWEKWEGKFNLCVKARNPYAHGHEDLLTAEEVQSLQIYCTEILRVLGNSHACDDPAATNLRAEDASRKRMYETYASIHEKAANASMLSKEINFCAAFNNQKTIHGYFEYRGDMYKGTISKKNWQAEYPDARLGELIGKEYKAVIKEVQNPYKVQLELV